MKKFSLFFYFAFCILHSSFAQLGEWTWVSGDTIPAQPGIFGTQGVPSTTNHPPGVYEPCEWTDQQGNLWLYGGIGGTGTFSDLWKYNVSTNEWTWVNGPSTAGQLPSYGTQGVSSPTNTPGYRAYGIMTWVDVNNNLWFFGGWSSSDNNDLWKYDITTNEWTWINGDTFTGGAGFYGTLGVASALNYPPARLEVACSWIDNANNLWLFGGEALSGHLNDLWRFDIAANQWTWMNGSNSTNAVDVYGTLGVSAPINTPGARQCYTHFKDLSGNLWLFGGTAYNPSAYNDLWKYDVATNEWAWMNGPNFQGDIGSYGTQCVASSSNLPGNRYENRSCWTDACGNFYVFGGVGYPSNGDYNDLWYYNVSANMWTWVSGDQTTGSPGFFGTQGLSSPTNMPPARMGASSWIDANGNLWLYGGFSSGFSQWGDLWRFVPDPSCTQCNNIPVAVFSAPHHICPGTCTDFTNLSTGATSYQWTFAGANPSTSTDVSPTNICYNTPGNYLVQLIATNANTSDTLALNNYITVYPYPAPQGISQSGDTLFANQGAVSYQWYHAGNSIPGATDYFYLATEGGDFNVVATDANGCEVEAAIFDVVASVPSLVNSLSSFVYPNPAIDKLEVGCPEAGDKEVSIEVYDMVGALRLRTANSKLPTELDVRCLSSGMYWLEISSAKKIFRLKFIKQ